MLGKPQLTAPRRRTFTSAILALTVVTGLAGAPFLTSALAKPTAAHTQLKEAGDLRPASFAEMIDAVKPAVVNISATGKNPNAQFGSRPEFQIPPGSPFEDFFERFFSEPYSNPPGHGTQRDVHAVGSGFIVDPEGYVVTNYHVIKGADEIAVITNSGDRHPAKLVGRDEKTDLALLKIDAGAPLAYVEFGDSDGVRVGDWVVAIGNPFGLGGTATTGIVSARGRDIRSGPLDEFLQIDAPINRGNSGGPLFDTSGRVIGVNTAIFSPNGGNVGIGFAIPASMASSVIEKLQTNGFVDRGWLGVQIQELTDDLAESLGLSSREGALVASVVKDSPAERGGLKTGDVIVNYDGQAVKRMRDLPRLVADTPAKREVRVKVWRDGENRTVAITVDAAPQSEVVARAADSEATAKPRLGVTLSALTDDLRTRYRISSNAEGVLVVDVAPDSPAGKKGVRPGDLIKRVGAEQVSEPGEVVTAVRRAADQDRKSVLLLIERSGNDRFVAVKFA
ncbi:MAG: DegQ family serine endoprotease [Gammaproteobacteria bacterium]|nr:DegQ family serine endoprotease [Gammaproteobacteria bacterium]